MLAAMIAFAEVPAAALVGSIKVPDDVLNHVAASTSLLHTPLAGSSSMRATTTCALLMTSTSVPDVAVIDRRALLVSLNDAAAAVPALKETVTFCRPAPGPVESAAHAATIAVMPRMAPRKTVLRIVCSIGCGRVIGGGPSRSRISPGFRRNLVSPIPHLWWGSK